jgi:hypothetical protein
MKTWTCRIDNDIIIRYWTWVHNVKQFHWFKTPTSIPYQKYITIFSRTTPKRGKTSGDSGLLMEMVHDRCSILLTEFSTALTILPILFQYYYKYCYSDSRNLWAVMKAGGLAP